ncbi:hypothetical protein GALL_452850 [mine drainage metagenome]|uniref:Uncharacterized protein n=1 Tax=mine drainage metagenome TaxID=410659 RepID=A0A1J5Q6K3_9ZZZZ
MIDQQRLHHAVAISPDFRPDHRQQADEQSHQPHAQRQEVDQRLVAPACGVEQPEKGGSEQPGNDADQHGVEQVGESHHRNDMRQVERTGGEQRLGGEFADHRGNQDGSDFTQREPTQNDFSNEQGAGNRRVVGTGEAGGRAAGDDEAAMRGVGAADASEQRRHQRGELDHRALAADGDAAAHADQRRQRAGEVGAERQDAVAHPHRLHVFRAARPLDPAMSGPHDQPAQRGAGCGNEHPRPRRQPGGCGHQMLLLGVDAHQGVHGLAESLDRDRADQPDECADQGHGHHGIEVLPEQAQPALQCGGHGTNSLS